MVINHLVVMELLHDIQLRTSVRKTVPGLKSLPHSSARREWYVGINQRIMDDAQQCSLALGLSMSLGLLILLGSHTGRLLLEHMTTTHG